MISLYYSRSTDMYCPYPRQLTNTIIYVDRVFVGDTATYACR